MNKHEFDCNLTNFTRIKLFEFEDVEESEDAEEYLTNFEKQLKAKFAEISKTEEKLKLKEKINLLGIVACYLISSLSILN